jgi:hypothetical protein
VVNNTYGDVCLFKPASWKALELRCSKAVNFGPKV